MKLKLLLNQLSQLDGISNFEYLVFRSFNGEVSTEFTEDEAKRIYEVISTLPFPLNTNPLSSDTIKRLMLNVPYNLHTEEQTAVQAALKNISEDLVILPFPKSLMQFYLAMAVKREAFFFGRVDEINSPDIRNQQKDVHNAAHDLLQLYINRALEKDKDYPIAVANINKSLSYDICRTVSYVYSGRVWINAEGHLQANKQFNALWVGLNKSLVKRIIGTDIADLKRLYKKLAYEFVAEYKEDKLVKFDSIFKHEASKVVDLFYFEIDIMFDPKYSNHLAIYRGNSGGYHNDINNYRVLGHNGSLSFGNGLCEGLLLDTGGCALKYLLKRNSGYVTFINIPNFLANKREHALYWIPPLTSATRVFGVGELFHVRTLGFDDGGMNQCSSGSLENAIQNIGGNKYLSEKSLVSWEMYKAMMRGNIRTIIVPHLSMHSINLTSTDNYTRYKRDVLSLPKAEETDYVVDKITPENFSFRIQKKEQLRWWTHQVLIDKPINNVFALAKVLKPKREVDIEKSAASDYGFKSGFLLKFKNGIF